LQNKQQPEPATIDSRNQSERQGYFGSVQGGTQ
jgi:hypothetical protein